MRVLKILVLMVLFISSRAEAAIDVLWYGEYTSYNNAFANLAASAHTWDPNGDGSLAWNLSIWNPGDPTPSFADYDVLVIGSGAAFGTGLDASRLLAAKNEIEAARGSRTFLSGQDADWHINAGSPGTDDGPRGFLINAVNWAGSGTGLGIVSLPDGWSGSGSQWWLDENSFLKSELESSVDYFQEESVVIPVATQDFPVNEGLTTAGLSNWGTAAHAGYFKSTLAGYTSINDAGTHPGYSVTVITESEASGGTQGGNIPEPSTLIIWSVLGILGLAVGHRRRQ